MTTIRELHKLCAAAIKAGLGDHQVWVPVDEEGNGFHPLERSLTTDVEEYDCMGDGMVNGRDVILG